LRKASWRDSGQLFTALVSVQQTAMGSEQFNEIKPSRWARLAAFA
jgi:hypothetical protein